MYKDRMNIIDSPSALTVLSPSRCSQELPLSIDPRFTLSIYTRIIRRLAAMFAAFKSASAPSVSAKQKPLQRLDCSVIHSTADIFALAATTETHGHWLLWFLRKSSVN